MAAEFNATFKITGLTINAEMEGGQVLQEKTVDPTLEGVTVTPDRGYTGLSSVEVNPVALQEKSVTPTVEAQTVEPDEGFLGMSSVAVGAIRLQGKEVAPATQGQTVTPDAGYDGLSSVSVGAVELQSKTVAPSEQTQTVTPDVEYMGLSSVEVEPIELQTKEAAPATTAQAITPDDGYDGLAAVNIEPMELQSKTVTPTQAVQTVTPDEGKDGLSAVEVGAIPSEYVIPSGTVAITQNGVANVAGYASADVDVQPTLQSKSVAPATTAQTVTPDSGYDGLSAVEVGAVALQSKSVTPTQSAQTVAPDSGYDGLSGVSVGAIPAEYIIPEGQVEITENGEVDVAAFASALVNVAGGGGASNLVMGDFTYANSGTGVIVATLDIPYTGQGFPLFIGIYPYDGAKNWIEIRNTQYSVGAFTAAKLNMTPPDYTASTGEDNLFLISTAEKGSTDKTVGYSGSSSTHVCGTGELSNTYYGILKFRSNTHIELRVKGSRANAGFEPGLKYRYIILYSE